WFPTLRRALRICEAQSQDGHPDSHFWIENLLTAIFRRHRDDVSHVPWRHPGKSAPMRGCHPCAGVRPYGERRLGNENYHLFGRWCPILSGVKDGNIPTLEHCLLKTW